MNPKGVQCGPSPHCRRVITRNPIESLGAALSPYRSGPMLVSFFNELGANDTYSFGGGCPVGRWSYAESRLDELNGYRATGCAIEAAVDLSTYLDSDFQVASPLITR